MAVSTRPSNAGRRFTEFRVDHPDDDNFPSPQPVPNSNSTHNTLGYQLDRIPQGSQGSHSTAHDYTIDPNLDYDDLSRTLDGRDTSLDSPADSKVDPTADSAYGGSPYPDRTASVMTAFPSQGKSKGSKNEAKNFRCDFGTCRKAFARRSDLVRHKRIHTNESRPFSCTAYGCGKSFIQRSALTVHSRTHTGERPHQCKSKDCLRTFSDSSSLARHKRVHTGARPYKCGLSVCGKTFCRKTTLLKHIKKQHPTERLEVDGVVVVDFANTAAVSRVNSGAEDGSEMHGVQMSGFTDDSGAELGTGQGMSPVGNSPGAADGWGNEGGAPAAVYALPSQFGHVSGQSGGGFAYDEHNDEYYSVPWFQNQAHPAPMPAQAYSHQPYHGHVLVSPQQEEVIVQPFSPPQSQPLQRQPQGPALPPTMAARPKLERISTDEPYHAPTQSQHSSHYPTAQPESNRWHQGYQSTSQSSQPHVYHSNPSPTTRYYSANPTFGHEWPRSVKQPRSFPMVAGSSSGSVYAPQSEAGSPQLAHPKPEHRFPAHLGLPQPSHQHQTYYPPPRMAPRQPVFYHGDSSNSGQYHDGHNHQAYCDPPAHVAARQPSRSLDSPHNSSGDGSMTLAPSGLTGPAADSPGMPFAPLQEEGRFERPEGQGVDGGGTGLGLQGMGEQEGFAGDGGGGGMYGRGFGEGAEVYT